MRSSHARRRRWRTLLPPAAPARPQPAPDRARALLAVSIALRDGCIEEGPCEICGAMDGVKAHIADPAQPFSWRCPAHMPGRS